MRRGILAAGFVGFAIALGPSTAFAHGGGYRGGQYDGPSDTTPPGNPGGDTTPPGNPSGPSTPGPGGPTTGKPRGPATGGAPPPGGATGGIRGGGLGGATKRNSGESFERWEFWWEHNKDPFLQLKARLGSRVVTSGASRFDARARSAGFNAAGRPTPLEIRRDIVPALVDGLSESHPDVADSAALALGRSIRAEDADPKLFAALKDALGHKEKSVREAATLALGVLGSAEATEMLRSLLGDTAEGRRLTAHPEGVEPLVRAFAAAALGLLHAQVALEDLEKAATDAGTSSLGAKGMAVLALGMLPERHDEIVRFLLALMQDRSVNNLVRAQAPIALGRLARQCESGSPVVHPVLASRLLPQFRDDKTDNDLRRSLAISIGMVASAEDADAIDALADAVANAKDDQTRDFAIMSLAQIGARDPVPAQHAETHAKLEEFFQRELAHPRHVTDQPYAALGYAIYARSDRLRDDFKPEVVRRMQDAFVATTNPSYQGAMAIALGLLDARSAADDLWKRYEDSNDAPLKGYIAVGLGLMCASNRCELLREDVQKKGLHPRFRLQVARALGLMGDVEALPLLIQYLQSAETIAESSSAAQAVGLIGDRSAVKPLLEIVNNKAKQPLQRGFAEIALGILAEKTALPWYVAFAVDANYRAKVDALAEILDLL
jgi:HEAT repeat protein